MVLLGGNESKKKKKKKIDLCETLGYALEGNLAFFIIPAMGQEQGVLWFLNWCYEQWPSTHLSMPLMLQCGQYAWLLNFILLQVEVDEVRVKFFKFWSKMLEKL